MANVEPLHVRDFGNDHLSSYQAVGEQLRSARLEKGLELEDAARELRIRRVYLEALEEGKPEQLPGTPYVAGFLRTYGAYLNLDGDLLVKQFAEQKVAAEPPPDLHFPEPQAEGRLPGLPVLVASVLLVGVIYGAWVLLQGGGDNRGAEVAEVPAELADRLPASDGALTSDQSGSASGRDVVAPAQAAQNEDGGQQFDIVDATIADFEAGSEVDSGTGSEAIAGDDAGARVADDGTAETAAREGNRFTSAVAAEATMDLDPSPQSQAEAAVDPGAAAENKQPTERSVVAALTPSDAVTVNEEALRAYEENADNAVPPPPPALTDESGRVYGRENVSARVILTAERDSWVQVQGSDNELVLSRILKAGDSYRVPDRDDLTLITGNAGGLRVEVDGRLMPSLGPAGAVRRGIPLDPSGLAAYLNAGG